MTTNEYLIHCAEMSGMELREKYPAEANSHRAMLTRRKMGALVASEFLEFREFLRHVGPRPEKGYTLDRLDNGDPEYAPGKVAWRSKVDQTRNRSNTVFLKDVDGTKRTLAEWARLTNQPRHTLYSRKRRGFPDAAVIHGTVTAAMSPTSIWPKGREAQWETGYRRDAWRLPLGRKELRAEFLLRISRARYQELMETAEGLIPPGVEAGPEHDELFKNIDGWVRELRRAAALLAQPGYREP